MKRMHVHVNVDNLAASIEFYERLYGVGPIVRKSDYAKWVLEDPCVNFAISQRATPGSAVSHLGIEVESTDELEQYNTRLQFSETSGSNTFVQPEKDARCCYAQSDKYWANDPGGITWEFFHTTGTSESYGDDRRQTACCS